MKSPSLFAVLLSVCAAFFLLAMLGCHSRGNADAPNAYMSDKQKAIIARHKQAQDEN